MLACACPSALCPGIVIRGKDRVVINARFLHFKAVRSEDRSVVGSCQQDMQRLRGAGSMLVNDGHAETFALGFACAKPLHRIRISLVVPRSVRIHGQGTVTGHIGRVAVCGSDPAWGCGSRRVRISRPAVGDLDDLMRPGILVSILNGKGSLYHIRAVRQQISLRDPLIIVVQDQRREIIGSMQGNGHCLCRPCIVLVTHIDCERLGNPVPFIQLVEGCICLPIQLKRNRSVLTVHGIGIASVGIDTQCPIGTGGGDGRGCARGGILRIEHGRIVGRSLVSGCDAVIEAMACVGIQPRRHAGRGTVQGVGLILGGRARGIDKGFLIHTAHAGLDDVELGRIKGKLGAIVRTVNGDGDRLRSTDATGGVRYRHRKGFNHRLPECETVDGIGGVGGIGGILERVGIGSIHMKGQRPIAGFVGIRHIAGTCASGTGNGLLPCPRHQHGRLVLNAKDQTVYPLIRRTVAVFGINVRCRDFSRNRIKGLAVADTAGSRGRVAFPAGNGLVKALLLEFQRKVSRGFDDGDVVGPGDGDGQRQGMVGPVLVNDSHHERFCPGFPGVQLLHQRAVVVQRVDPASIRLQAQRTVLGAYRGGLVVGSKAAPMHAGFGGGQHRPRTGGYQERPALPRILIRISHGKRAADGGRVTGIALGYVLPKSGKGQLGTIVGSVNRHLQRLRGPCPVFVADVDGELLRSRLPFIQGVGRAVREQGIGIGTVRMQRQLAVGAVDHDGTARGGRGGLRVVLRRSPAQSGPVGEHRVAVHIRSRRRTGRGTVQGVFLILGGRAGSIDKGAAVDPAHAGLDGLKMRCAKRKLGAIVGPGDGDGQRQGMVGPVLVNDSHHERFCPGFPGVQLLHQRAVVVQRVDPASIRLQAQRTVLGAYRGGLVVGSKAAPMHAGFGGGQHRPRTGGYQERPALPRILIRISHGKRAADGGRVTGIALGYVLPKSGKGQLGTIVGSVNRHLQRLRGPCPVFVADVDGELLRSRLPFIQGVGRAVREQGIGIGTVRMQRQLAVGAVDHDGTARGGRGGLRVVLRRSPAQSGPVGEHRVAVHIRSRRRTGRGTVQGVFLILGGRAGSIDKGAAVDPAHAGLDGLKMRCAKRKLGAIVGPGDGDGQLLGGPLPIGIDGNNRKNFCAYFSQRKAVERPGSIVQHITIGAVGSYFQYAVTGYDLGNDIPASIQKTVYYSVSACLPGHGDSPRIGIVPSLVHSLFDEIEASDRIQADGFARRFGCCVGTFRGPALRPSDQLPFRIEFTAQPQIQPSKPIHAFEQGRVAQLVKPPSAFAWRGDRPGSRHKIRFVQRGKELLAGNRRTLYDEVRH